MEEKKNFDNWLVGSSIIFLIIFAISGGVGYMLFSLSLLIKDFLQIFVSPLTRIEILQLVYLSLTIIPSVIVVVSSVFAVAFLYSLGAFSKKYEKTTVALSLYITFFLFMLILGLTIFVVPTLHSSAEVMVITIVEIVGSLSILLYSIFFLLRLCSKHPVLDILLLIWLEMILLLFIIYMILMTSYYVNTDAKQIDWQQISILFITLLIFVGVFISVLWRLCKIKENSYLFIWDDVVIGNTAKFIKFLKDDLKIEWIENAEIKKSNNKTITVTDKNNNANLITIKLNKAEKKVNLEIARGKTYEYISKEKKGKQPIYEKSYYTYFLSDSFWKQPVFLLANRIFFFTILTLALFAIGTIFISGFTHVKDYKQLENETNKNMSDICNLHSENSINAINETLTVESNSEKHTYTLTLSSLCKQYDQDRKDFVTYFSTLIGAVIAFFITMYNKFIRTKERNKENTKKDESQK